MKEQRMAAKTCVVSLAAGILWLAACEAVQANGGPFVVQYPGGDPAAKGVLARLDPGLKPGREERLAVTKENLTIVFNPERFIIKEETDRPPLANVSAEYLIRNPTDEEIEMDFGFPILRGIYVHPHAMVPRPDVRVEVDGRGVPVDIISNSAIYGIIRGQARAVIDEGIASDPALSNRVRRLSERVATGREPCRAELAEYLTHTRGWGERDAALLVEYASLDLSRTDLPRTAPIWSLHGDAEMYRLATGNLGVLAAIGEQKATQFLARLAGQFDAEGAAGYERIFTAWGGDVRERSVDLETGGVRPREITVGSDATDATLYARVDYLDPNAKLTKQERASCEAILKNLPVIFTFAPMNLIHYRAKFEPGTEKIVRVAYSQYAYLDTREPRTYQLAYVVHPASLWKDFGPIRLTVQVPEAVEFAASVPYERGTGGAGAIACKPGYVSYTANLEDKTGELFVAVAAEDWHLAMGAKPATELLTRLAGE